MNVYEAADKAIREMNRANLKAFNRLKLAKWDELHVIRQVDGVYEESIRLARKKYQEIAMYAYLMAMQECGVDHKQAQQKAGKSIDRDFILDLLEEADPVTKYIFLEEAKRKEQRLLEAVEAAQNRNAEIDRALKYWTGQVGQYADNSVYRARLQAFQDAGVKRVMWVTQRDGRVCSDCDDLDGLIFPISQVPPPQHIHCRCELHPVLN